MLKSLIFIILISISQIQGNESTEPEVLSIETITRDDEAIKLDFNFIKGFEIKNIIRGFKNKGGKNDDEKNSGNEDQLLKHAVDNYKWLRHITMRNERAFLKLRKLLGFERFGGSFYIRRHDTEPLQIVFKFYFMDKGDDDVIIDFESPKIKCLEKKSDAYNNAQYCIKPRDFKYSNYDGVGSFYFCFDIFWPWMRFGVRDCIRSKEPSYKYRSKHNYHWNGGGAGELPVWGAEGCSPHLLVYTGGPTYDPKLEVYEKAMADQYFKDCSRWKVRFDIKDALRRHIDLNDVEM